MYYSKTFTCSVISKKWFLPILTLTLQILTGSIWYWCSHWKLVWFHTAEQVRDSCSTWVGSLSSARAAQYRGSISAVEVAVWRTAGQQYLLCENDMIMIIYDFIITSLLALFVLIPIIRNTFKYLCPAVRVSLLYMYPPYTIVSWNMYGHSCSGIKTRSVS